MQPVESTLRELLRRADGGSAVEAHFRDGGKPESIGALLTSHVGDVLQRVDCVVGDDGRELWPIKLTALVHEVPPAELPSLLEAAGFADVVPQVVAIVEGFGAVWKARDANELADYVPKHADHLQALLIFETAHEGRATAAMLKAAALAGIEDDLVRRQTRLEEFADRGSRKEK